MDWLTRLEAPQNALAILTAMITPAVLLIVESRMALGAIHSEMDFLWKVSTKAAGKDLKSKPGGPFTWLGRKI